MQLLKIEISMEDTTQPSVTHGIEIDGDNFVYNNTFVFQKTANGTPTHRGIEQPNTGTLQLYNNVFVIPDVDNIQCIRLTQEATLDTADGNIFSNPGGQDFCRVDDAVGGPSLTFSEWESLTDVGGEGEEKSTPVTILDANSVPTVPTMADFALRVNSFDNYGAGVNCHTLAGITHKFMTSWGANGTFGVRKGDGAGNWFHGPILPEGNQDGVVVRTTDDVVIFPRVTIDTTWQTSMRLLDGPSIAGRYTAQQGIKYVQFSADSASEVTICIHTGSGPDMEVIFAGTVETGTPLTPPEFDPPRYGGPGKDLYLTVMGGAVGSDILTGEIRCVRGAATTTQDFPKPRVSSPLHRS